MSGFFWKKKKGASVGQGAGKSAGANDVRFDDTAELDGVCYGDEVDEGGEDEKTQLSTGLRRPSLQSQPLQSRPPPHGTLDGDEDGDEKTALSAPARSALPRRPTTRERLGPPMGQGSLYSRLVEQAPATGLLADDEKTCQLQRGDLTFSDDEEEEIAAAPAPARPEARRPAPAEKALPDEFQDWLGATPALEGALAAATAEQTPEILPLDSAAAHGSAPGKPDQVPAALRGQGSDLPDEALDEDIAEISPVPEEDGLGAGDLQARARGVELLVLDVDGVLTDGGLYYGPQGEALKRFHVQDGHGIALARKAGLQVAILTARTSQIVERRAGELGIAPVFQGRKDKVAGFEALLAETGLGADRVAYMGDDLNDLGVLARVRLSACPADACPEVCERAHVVVSTAGGSGAVRELIEFILKAQGKWAAIVQGALGA